MKTGGIVAVHAHPDDESITMGATLARYCSLGIPVTLVTATLGEHGETMYGHLDGLDAEHADQLGGYRWTELHAACRALGITDQRMLGGLGRFRDSGMAGEPSAGHPRAFVRAQTAGPDHGEAVAALVAVFDDVVPGAVLTYDPTGGYGHPDHVTTHQVTAAAYRQWYASGGAGSGRDCRLWQVMRPRSALAAALAELWRGPVPSQYRRPGLDDLGTLAADEEIDIAIPAGPWRAARRAAMSSHATQLDVWAGPTDGFALTNLKAQPLLPMEYFRLLAGPPVPPGAADLLAGLPGNEDRGTGSRRAPRQQ